MPNKINQSRKIRRKQAVKILNLDIRHPQDWFNFSRCKYNATLDPYGEVIYDQNWLGERCAIQRYKEIADYTSSKDHTTHQIATTILNEELEHENDIEDWITDINRKKEEFKKSKM